jgi:pyruvate/2-oxoglutarate dehydrogenase complex dihydrolipoamide acyltransferase (E2) component
MEVRIPEEIIEPGAEGVISVWLFKTGERVVQGDVLAEVMNAKAATQLEAPATGRLTILVDPEVAIRSGDVIARID